VVKATNTGSGAVTISYAEPLIATTTTLAASPDPGTAGTATTLTATVTPASGTTKPTGTVTFKDGSTTLGTVNVDPGRATFTVTLAAGIHHLTASYNGTTSFAASATISTLSYTVAAATSTASSTTVTSSSDTLPDSGAHDVGAQTGIGLAAVLLGLLALVIGGRRHRPD
jgi:hypothetical protein